MKNCKFARVLVGVIPLILFSCQHGRVSSLSANDSDQVPAVLVAAASNSQHEDCQPLVHEVSIGRLSASTIEEIKKNSEFSRYQEVLDQLQSANAESRQIHISNSAVVMLSNEEYQEIVSADDDYLTEIVRIAPNACQLTRMSTPVFFEDGRKAAVFIARARGRLAAEVHLLILERKRDGWHPINAILILLS